MKRTNLNEEKLIKRVSYGRMVMISSERSHTLHTSMSDPFSVYPYCVPSQNLCKCLAGCSCYPTHTACNVCQASFK